MGKGGTKSFLCQSLVQRLHLHIYPGICGINFIELKDYSLLFDEWRVDRMSILECEFVLVLSLDKTL